MNMDPANSEDSNRNYNYEARRQRFSNQNGRSKSSSTSPSRHYPKSAQPQRNVNHKSTDHRSSKDKNLSEDNSSKKKHQNKDNKKTSEDHKNTDDDVQTPKDMVITVMRKLISNLRSSSELFSNYIQEFNPDHQKFGPLIVEECSPSAEEVQEASDQDASESRSQANNQQPLKFDVRLLMTTPHQPATFELLSGHQHGVPSGQVALSIAVAFTPEERSDVRREWSPCLNDMTLCPHKIHGWLSKGIIHGVKKLKCDEMQGRNVSFMVSNEFPAITIILTAVGKDRDNTQVITINLIPAIEISTLPRGATIQSPFPKLMPYSIEGRKIAKKIYDNIHNGQLTYIAEIPKQSQNDSNQVARRIKTAPAGGRRRQQQDEPPEKAYWKINMSTITNKMIRMSMKSETLEHAQDIPNIFQKLQTEKGGIWLFVSSEVISCVLLWTIKKYAGVAESKKDWFLYFCHNLQAAMAHRYCPDFFLPLCNILAGKDADLMKMMNTELSDYLTDVDHDRRTQELLLGED